MTKDEIIADLRGQVATLSRLLEVALAPKPLAPSTERTRAWRERHRDGHGNGHSDVRGDYRGEASGSSSGSTEPTSPEATNPEVEAKPGESREGKRHRDVPTDPDWQTFRETYPKTDRTSWAKAESYWRKLSEDDRKAALAGCLVLAANPPAPEYVKGAQSWLNERRWETVADRPSGNGHNGHDTQAVLRSWLEKNGGDPHALDRRTEHEIIEVNPL
jgi:hypothetical protein